ncbi:MAG: AMP-binding protein [Candidatus Eisenbacteria bacterium]
MNDSLYGALRERLFGTLERRADATVLTFLDAKLEPAHFTGGQLLARAHELAGRFRALGLERGAPLGILSSAQPVQVLHFLGALEAGLMPALLTPPSRKLSMAHYHEMLVGVTRRCRFAALVADVVVPGLETIVLAPGTLECTRTLATRTQPSGADDARQPPVSFLQFSSGTTGIKRGVRIADAAVLAQLDTYAGAIALEPEDVIVSWLPLYHDMGFVACLLMPLAHGTPVVMLNPLDWVARPASWLHAASRFGGTLAWHPNFAFSFMAERAAAAADDPAVDLSRIRALFNCSEPATFASQQRFLERFRARGLRADVFRGCYAMAETTFALTHGRCDDPGYRDSSAAPGETPPAGAGPAISVGRPLPGVRLEIVDETGTPLPERMPGEIRVRSPFNLAGYHHNPEDTAAAIRDGWYHTGDRGYFVGEELFVCGRAKDMLIVAGVNVWPQDVESLACEAPGVHPGRAVAFSQFDAASQTERLVVLAEPEPGRELDPALDRAIVTAIRQRILAALQVAQFDVHLVPPGWLSKSSSGKMARERNRARWAEQGQSGVAHAR